MFYLNSTSDMRYRETAVTISTLIFGGYGVGKHAYHELVDSEFVMQLLGRNGQKGDIYEPKHPARERESSLV